MTRQVYQPFPCGALFPIGYRVVHLNRSPRYKQFNPRHLLMVMNACPVATRLLLVVCVDLSVDTV